jgi:hypothetical protein
LGIKFGSHKRLNLSLEPGVIELLKRTSDLTGISVSKLVAKAVIVYTSELSAIYNAKKGVSQR